MTDRRKLKAVVLSDIHLGSIGCHARELVDYLSSIEPELLFLNGDIIDVWAFNKRFWPVSHTQVLQQLLLLMSRGTTIYYLTGNHDDILRRYSDAMLGNLHLVDKLVIELDGKKYWFFHGDVFDLTMRNSRWLARLGGMGYDLLILLNRSVNWVLQRLGRERISLSKRIKHSVKRAVAYISEFEKTVISLALEQGYDYVVCGHIHQPEIKVIQAGRRKVIYLNAGDWVENLTALEYNQGTWKLFTYPAIHLKKQQSPSNGQLYPLSAELKTNLMQP
ncbi:MAG: UDP-2,3-diacylglucosamine diphosphatase [Chitinophagales bacterium]|nr:UDP-2,3-diacylglucosamine diphosphatase [Chitinophagales bacterium]MDW8427840.1 UDP-2,3-diacylglucosamine diphosphatase [Chitinophagales bacterium]